jgi:glucose dehydrogenase
MLWGGILWILGLAGSIVGMNIQGDTGKLVAVIGNIAFLIGLALVGAAWMLSRRNAEKKREE